MNKIILASQSPRRKQLLEWAEQSFEIIVPSTDESYPSTMPLKEIPVFIALQKAKAVQELLTKEDRQKIILAADTIVLVEDKITGKPSSRNEAIKMLTLLSGKTHEVITGVAIIQEEHLISFADITTVCFHELTREQIVFYVDNYKPYDKAGAYAIQEWIGVVGIKKIEGDFYNVMGLPISRVLQKLSML